MRLPLPIVLSCVSLGLIQWSPSAGAAESLPTGIATSNSKIFRVHMDTIVKAPGHWPPVYRSQGLACPAYL